MPGDEATARLRDALSNPDAVVRGHAALALGTRGVPEAIPVLIDMIVAGRNDTDAADALSMLASDTATVDQIAANQIAADRIAANQIATGLVDRLADDTTEAPARVRLTQALADIPGSTASDALVELAQDGNRAVAVTATYLLRLRDAQ